MLAWEWLCDVSVCASRVHALCTCVYMPFVYVPFRLFWLSAFLTVFDMFYASYCTIYVQYDGCVFSLSAHLVNLGALLASVLFLIICYVLRAMRNSR